MRGYSEIAPRSVQQSPFVTRCGPRAIKELGQQVICYTGFLTKLDSCVYSVIIVHVLNNAKP